MKSGEVKWSLVKFGELRFCHVWERQQALFCNKYWEQKCTKSHLFIFVLSLRLATGAFFRLKSSKHVKSLCNDYLYFWCCLGFSRRRLSSIKYVVKICKLVKIIRICESIELMKFNAFLWILVKFGELWWSPVKSGEVRSSQVKSDVVRWRAHGGS